MSSTIDEKLQDRALGNFKTPENGVNRMKLYRLVEFWIKQMKIQRKLNKQKKQENYLFQAKQELCNKEKVANVYFMAELLRCDCSRADRFIWDLGRRKKIHGALGTPDR